MPDKSLPTGLIDWLAVPHNLLLAGKLIEIIGAALIAWVAIQACVLEVIFIAPLETSGSNEMEETCGSKEMENDNFLSLQERLKKVNERKRQQFGYWESISVAIGSIFIFAGCIFYIVGLYL